MRLIGFFLGLGAKVKLAMAAIAGFLVIIALAVAKGQSMQNVKNERQKAKEYRKTTEDIADAKPIDRNADNARDRLSKRNKR